jgi:ankyrin repeat protein
VERKSTSWLAAALLVGGDPNVSANIRLPRGRDTVLCLAARSGYEDGVRLLQQFGADPNREGFSGWNALAMCVRHPSIVALLLEKGADANGTRADGRWNPLEQAARDKDIESMRLLLQFGADPNIGRALAASAHGGYEDAVRLLLESGANPEGNKKWLGQSALAEGAKYPAIVALLLQKGANPNAMDAFFCFSPLASAARARSVESLRLMFAHGGDARRVDPVRGNVLHAALECSDAECCRELLAHGADPCGRRASGDTPMHVVARNARRSNGPEFVKTLDLLLEVGASVQAVNADGLTPGQVARQDQYTSKDVLEWFVQHEAL